MEYATLQNGLKMPMEGSGVFQVRDKEECKRSVLDAIRTGYRLIDTAASYTNEDAVGEAVRAREAKTRQVTRATVSMEHAANIDKPVIFAVGNAPTALISLYELMQKSDWRPAFIIGVPVGFVNVEAAKELILKTDVPHIVNRGRKGGSNVAAAIVNALLYQIRPV